MLKRDSRNSGFTLLELLIVVIIVGILAAVAVPQFGKMTRRAKFSEGQTAVGAILTAESLYYQENEKFGNKADLLVDYNETNYGYTVTPTGSTNAKVVADGKGTFTGLQVTGTVDNTGARTVTTN